MEFSEESKERVQKIAKYGILAIAAGGVAVKIFHREDGWGYAHLTDRANLWLGAIKEGTSKPVQLAGKLNNTVAEILHGAEPDITWDGRGEGDDLVAEIEPYIGDNTNPHDLGG